MDYEGEVKISDVPMRLSTMLGDRALTLHFSLCVSINSACSFTNGEPLLGGLLLGDSHGGLVCSGNVLGSLNNMELDVAV